MKLFLTIVLVLTIATVALPASAALFTKCTGELIPGTTERQCTFCDLFATGQNILNSLIGFAVAAAGIGIVIGGFYIMISGGNEELYKRGMNALRAGVIGLIVVFSAYVIVNAIINAVAPGAAKVFPWPWNKVRCI